MFVKNRNEQPVLFTEPKILKEARNCLVHENIEIVTSGDRFMKYFVKNSASDEVLIKTIKEMTSDLNIPTYTLIKILNILEYKKIIYRRNGIIGLWRN
ncbi:MULTISPECIES: replication/maintenance protein RepL [Planococcus]|uniref:replication/maintenance protein RepL n=1 Tax=Planococcus TaxID=1372 RepID=UPI00115F46EA|nr:replication/maintenance protein RepL [Planococcus soli]